MNDSIRTVAILMLMTVAQFAEAKIVFKDVLDKVYGGYDQKNNCWTIKDDDGNYCMKIDSVDRIVVNKRQRIYLLLTADLSSPETHAHADQGLVGAFVLEKQNGQTKIIAGNAKISSGIDGEATKKWHFVKLGANYWGWANTFSSYHSGYLTSMYSILAPHDTQVVELANFMVYRSNELDIVDENTTEKNNPEPCVDEDNQPCSSISAEVKIDTHQGHRQVYPLLVTVTGNEKGKKLKPHTWTFAFDTKKWAYIEPEQWPLKF